jgi:hypothetical protein
MEEPSNQSWFLRKHEDGSIFGPLPFEQLALWASTAQIAPYDAVSIDQQTWMKAPMLPQLGMDWLVEVTSEHYYGPTTLGAIEEFIRLGEISAETFVINSCNGARRQIQEMPALLKTSQEDGDAATSEDESNLANEPAATGISIRLQERVRDLEQSLREERRALMEAEQRYQELERKYEELGQQARSKS